MYLKNKTSINFIILLFNKGLLFEKLQNAGIEPYLMNMRFKYNMYAVKKIANLFKQNNINVVHTHGYKATILGGMAAKFCRIRVLKTEHGVQEPAEGFGYVKMSLNLYLDRLFSKYLLDSIVFVSKDIQNHFNKIFLNSKQYVIYNGIEPIETENNADNEIDKEFFNIGIVGRISEVKGHIYLLKAMKQLQHLDKIRLYIFGEGPLERDYKNYCDENGLSRKVYFMGFKKNIYDYMSKFDLLVMPSLHEGLPYTLLEAMFLRIPIIASEIGGIGEILEDNIDALLIPPADEDKLADAIVYLYDNQEERKRLIVNAYEKVSRQFLVDKMFFQYLHVYRDALGRNCCSLWECS
jgi:glycosyltransferase involved in cell wall biosynthesis